MSKPKWLNDLQEHRNIAVSDNTPPVCREGETAASWFNERRNEILAMYEKYMYGRIPPRAGSVEFRLVREKKTGLMIRREVEIICRNEGRTFSFPVLWLIPAQAEGPVPCITALNFCGNAGVLPDEDLPDDSTGGKGHGWQAHRWAVPYFMEQKVALVTAARNAVFCDQPSGRRGSIFSLFHEPEELGEDARSFTAISGWAAGYRLLLELALTDPEHIDARRIWAHGHSRLGKTALWAGANESRFAGVVSNDSGCCGASLFRGQYGEKLENITAAFPHWSPEILDSFRDDPARLPFDQHFLLGLIAPRPLLVASASEDIWASPMCEFAAACTASRVWRLFGADGMPDGCVFPEPGNAVFGDCVAYSLRKGPHDVTVWDWEQVFGFMRRCGQL